MEVRRDGDPLEVPAGKPRALLALLLLRAGDVVATDSIAEALWPEGAPPTGANAIQQYVAHLRRVLGPTAIETRAPGYVLRLDRESLDVDRADRLARAGREALDQGRPAEATRLLRQALALFRGMPLADFRYDAFAQAESARLEEARLAITEDWIQAELALGRHDDVVGELEVLVSEHPLREGPRGQLMLALYRAGRQADALAVYQVGRRMLVEGLGVAPSPALQELHRGILNQDASLGLADRRPVSAPPVPPTPILGRDGETAELLRLLREGEARVVTVCGPGGIGKTRLALEAAHALRADFDEVAWVELAATRDPELVPSVIAGELGATGEPSAHVGDRRVLLVLDNVEQVIEGAQWLGHLVAACPNLVLLVTSRERLRLRGEREFVLGPLSQGAAVELFRAGAAAVNARLDATDDVAEVCRRLDRLPLCIELASARTKLLDPREMLARLDRRLELLVDGARDAPERHRTLSATIKWSYDLLDDQERRLFEDLAVFAGRFAPADVEAVCGARLDTLVSLLDKSLIGRGVGGDGLSLLATIREFALERLAARPDADEVRRRHAMHVAQEVERADQLVTGPDQADALASIARRQDDLRGALEWALGQRDGALAHRLVAAAGWFWFVRGHLAEGRRWLEAALALDGDVPAETRATACMRMGTVSYEHGDLDGAARWLREALELRRALGDRAGTAGALANLGNVAMFSGDYGKARRLFEEGLEIARELGDPDVLAAALHNVAQMHTIDGHAAAAIPLLEESLALVEAIGNRYGEAVARTDLGAALADCGSLAAAGVMLAAAVRLRLELDEPSGIAIALSELAWLAHLSGERESAPRRLGAAAAIRAAIGTDLGRSDAARLEQTELRAREAGGAEAFERAHAETRALTLEEAIRFAAAEAERLDSAPADAEDDPVPV